MIFFLGSRIPKNKKLLFSLTAIKGFNHSMSKWLMSSFGLPFFLRVGDTQSNVFVKIQKLIFLLKLIFGTDVVQQRTSDSREKLRLIKHRRAIRFFQGLPVRGQRTRTNAQTASKQKSKRSL